MADTTHGGSDSGTRRDFMNLLTNSVAVFGAAVVAWPMISSLNPSQDVLALSSIEVDLSQIEVGQAITVKWRGKPVFIRRRTPEEIKTAEDVDVATLRDPQPDSARVQKPEWLIAGRRVHPPRLRAAGPEAVGAARPVSAAGSARATARNTTPLDASAAAPRRPIWRCRLYTFESDSLVKIG